jgi:hypothetical protein
MRHSESFISPRHAELEAKQTPYGIRYHHGSGRRCACEIVNISRVLPSGPLLQVCYREIRQALLFLARFMEEIARLLQTFA